MGRTLYCRLSSLRPRRFQLTRPVRGEPQVYQQLAHLYIISTHSPRAGRTSQLSCHNRKHDHFNSLAPCGANLSLVNTLRAILPFQLTRPMRGEPNCNIRDLKLRSISTHSPHAGRTACFAPSTSSRWDFNSLAPCGANLDVANLGSITVNISTHSPRAGRTPLDFRGRHPIDISTHSPRAGRTLSYVYQAVLPNYFNSLAPCGANPLR